MREEATSSRLEQAFQTVLAQVASLGVIPLLLLAENIPSFSLRWHLFLCFLLAPISQVTLTLSSFPHLKGLCSVRLVDKLLKLLLLVSVKAPCSFDVDVGGADGSDSVAPSSSR